MTKSKNNKLMQPIRPLIDQAKKHNVKQDLIFGIFLFVATLIAYQPAWNGKLVWDDSGHITKPDLRSLDGIVRIWTQLGATQQYYPLVHTVFWLEYHLWGDSTLGYHIVNILLHFFSAVLLFCILRRLIIPRPWFIAAIFALHPIQVESVAWISELKNVLSGIFFFSTVLAYLHYDLERKKKHYVIAISLFILGLMSKSAIATLPVTLLAIFWWKRERIDWKHDAVPLLLFFVVGISAGLFTAWVEHRFIIGNEQSTFSFSFIERCLIAGRVFWFYLSKLAWPVNLIFIYPRWNVSQAVWWQYLFPIATIVLAGVFWLLRKRWRAPLAGFIYFTAILFPAMGFFNVYPFRFSFVADHFQYLACIGAIALLAVVLEKGFSLLKGNMRLAPYLILLLTLGVLTWNQSRIYVNAETLYRDTIRKNPGCWMAHNNLGIIVEESGRTDEALVHYQKALEFYPLYREAHFNLGILLAKINQTTEAISHFRKVLEIKPDYSEAHFNLGNALLQAGKPDKAITQYQMALEINANYSEAHNNLGTILLESGRLDEAIAHYRKALEIKPGNADAHYNLGKALAQAGQTDEAISHFWKALEINPYNTNTLQNLAYALAQKGQLNVKDSF